MLGRFRPLHKSTKALIPINFWLFLTLFLVFGSILPQIQTGAIPTNILTGWKQYANEEYGYQFYFPPNSSMKPSDDPQPTILLPIQPKTNLVELSLEISIFNPSDESTSKATTDVPSASKEAMVIGPNTFIHKKAGDAGAGNYFNEELFSSTHGDTTISFHFRIHSVNPDIPEPHLRQFDQHQLDRLIKDILSTLKWSL